MELMCKYNRLLEVCDASTSNTAEIRLGANNSKASQKFDVKFNEEDGTYTIKAVHSGLVLDVRNASTKIGAVVQQYSSNNSDAQKWIIDKDENGDCTIISKSNGLVLDVQSGSSAVGARIQTFYSNKTNAQKFVFDECEPLKPEKTVQDGTYRIMCMNNLKQVFDIDAGSVNNGALLQTWSISNVA